MASKFLETFAEFASGLSRAGKPSPSALGSLDAKIAALDEQRAALVKQREEMAAALQEKTQFSIVLPDRKKWGHIHDQLLANERVHPLDDVEELVRMRIGTESDNKRCFVRLTGDKKPVVTAGIFTAMVDITGQGADNPYRGIPGNIDDIKRMPVEPFSPTEETQTVAAILYTISRNDGQDWDRGGKPLAETVYKYLNGQAETQGFNLVISTLSPIRTPMPDGTSVNRFGQWLVKQPGYEGIADENGHATPEFGAFLLDEKEHDQLRKFVLQYLLTQKDGVMKFHLGNGAYIGDIKFNPGNAEDWAMVNYVYPNDPEELSRNRDYFKTSQSPIVAPHLQKLIGYDAELQSKATVMLGQSL